MKRIIYAPGAPEPIGPYSQAVLVDDTLYCSGQIAIDDLGADIAAQTKAVCTNIGRILAVAGMRMGDVVKTTCYLSDLAEFGAFNDEYGRHFSDKPARSTVEVAALPRGARVEIEVLAVKA
jgi:2-iminobutanoate/2-iminopropanoate deaminase